MPSIILDSFGGLNPRIVNGRKLPKKMATRAQNVDLTSGDLVPITVEPPFQSLHNSDGSMKAGLTKGDLTYIPTPPTVTESAKYPFAVPNVSGDGGEVGWWRLTMYVWITYVDASNVFQDTLLYSGSATPNVSFTKDGMIATVYLNGTIDFNTVGGIGYTVRGPIFKWSFFEDTDYRGGPDEAFAFPANSSWADPTVTQFAVPLTFPTSMENFDPTVNGRGDGAGVPRYTYGSAELIDYDIPRFETQIVTDNDVTAYEIFSGFAAMTFTFRNNYVRPAQALSFYKQSYVDQTVCEGDLNTAVSGATTQVDLKDPLTFGESDIAESGRLYMKNAAGEFETVEYSSYSKNPTTDVHEFTIDETLTYSYVEDDLIEVIDPTSTGREGPPSEESALITNDPGEFSVLDVDNNPRYPRVKLYRSSGTGYNLLYNDALYSVSGSAALSGMGLDAALVKGTEITSVTVTKTSDLSSLPNVGAIRIGTTDIQEIRYTSRSASLRGGGIYEATFRFEKVTVNYNYASSTNVDAYETEADLTYDLFNVPLTDALPPYGNFPQDTITEALAGSLFHPNNWGVVFDGKDVRPSDIFRTWSLPEAYAITMPTTIIAGAISGNSIIVFTEGTSTEVGKVWELAGSNPQFLSMYELSNAHPLLNKIGLAKIGQTVIWPTYDGLAATAGGSVQLLTEKYFTREEWDDHSPQLMNAYTSENTVWLITAGALNWRMDLDELPKPENIFLSTFTVFSGEPFIWESKIFEFPRPIAFSCIQVDAESYPVAVEFFGEDGNVRHSELVTNDQVKKLRRMRTEKAWYIRVHGTNTVFSVGVSTNPGELSANGG